MLHIRPGLNTDSVVSPRERPSNSELLQVLVEVLVEEVPVAAATDPAEGGVRPPRSPAAALRGVPEEGQEPREHEHPTRPAAFYAFSERLQSSLQLRLSSSGVIHSAISSASATWHTIAPGLTVPKRARAAPPKGWGCRV